VAVTFFSGFSDWLAKSPMSKGGKTMGVFSVPIRVRNWQNRFLPAAKQGEEVTCNALVDTGALELALPAELIECLKLEPIDTVSVYDAGGAQHECRVFGIVELEVQERTCHVRVIELPHGAEPLLGAVPLEEMDWRVSPQERRLIPNPKSPDKPLLPLCWLRLGPGISPVRQ
jgi:clan AA aspartic protease